MDSEGKQETIPSAGSRRETNLHIENGEEVASASTCKCIACNLSLRNAEELLPHKLSCTALGEDYSHTTGGTEGILYRRQTSPPAHVTTREDATQNELLALGNDCDEALDSAVEKSRYLDAKEEYANQALAGLENRCVVCSKSFMFWRKLRRHMTMHDPAPSTPGFFENCRTEDGRYQCLICGVYRRSLLYVRRHFSLHTKERPFRCPKCTSSFKTSCAFLIHFKRLHTNLSPVYKCNKCDFTTKHRNMLKMHANRHDGILDSERCEVCFKMVTKTHIREHYFVHTGERPYPCQTCGRNFRLKRNMIVHMKRVHLGQEPERKYRNCQVCGKQRACGKYETHMRRHTDEPTDICCLCGRRFYSSKPYLRHMERVHIRIRDHKCPVCQKAFYSLPEVQQHVPVHIEERRFKCEVCGKAFKWKHKIGDHMKTHSEERPFKCDLCGEAFKWKHNLANHVRAKH